MQLRMPPMIGAHKSEYALSVASCQQLFQPFATQLRRQEQTALVSRIKNSISRMKDFLDRRMQRIWHAFDLQPHRSETFKLSTDPLFIDKVRDIVGLYLAPPERAIVLCVDEKSQIQALDRSQPLLPMRPGQVERRTQRRSWQPARSRDAAIAGHRGVFWNDRGHFFRLFFTPVFFLTLRSVFRPRRVRSQIAAKATALMPR